MSADIAHDREYDTAEQRLRQRLGGFRTIVGVPIQSDEEVMAVISLWRREVNPLKDREIELATTFAAQGAIAIRNASLMQQLDQRTQELGRSVDQLNGLSEVAQAVSSSLDPEEVLSTIVKHAVELSGTEGGSIFEFDDYVTGVPRSAPLTERAKSCWTRSRARRSGSTTRSLVVRPRPAPRSPSPISAKLRRTIIWPSVPGRLALDSRGSTRSRRPNSRRACRPPPPVQASSPSEIKELLETFASQSALAIHNARLFHTIRKQATELAEWNRELERGSRNRSRRSTAWDG